MFPVCPCSATYATLSRSSGVCGTGLPLGPQPLLCCWVPASQFLRTRKVCLPFCIKEVLVWWVLCSAGSVHALNVPCRGKALVCLRGSAAPGTSSACSKLSARPALTVFLCSVAIVQLQAPIKSGLHICQPAEAAVPASYSACFTIFSLSRSHLATAGTMHLCHDSAACQCEAAVIACGLDAKR